jgi:hypothetical protein
MQGMTVGMDVTKFPRIEQFSVSKVAWQTVADAAKRG